MWGKVSRHDVILFSQNNGTPDNVFQLSDIPRPVVTLETLDRFCGDRFLRRDVSAELFRKISGQQSNIFLPFP